MADVYCATCREPWDTYHLIHDLIHEVEGDPAAARKWVAENKGMLPQGGVRESLALMGWEFGRTMVNVLKCPSCESKITATHPDVGVSLAREALEDILGPDVDGLTNALQDHGL